MIGKCDPDIFKNGTPIAIVADRNGDAVEVLVQDVQLLTGVRMDWFYVGGRGVVKAIGDLELARGGFRCYENAFLKVVE